LDYVLYAFIPRFFWKEKPVITQGSKFAEYLGTQKVSIGMGAIGELYWNFGVVGILAGMALIGMLWGYLVNIFINISSPFFKGLGFMIVTVHISSLAEWGSSLIGIITFIVIFKAIQITTKKLELPI
jgi:hypothetical protein